MNKPVVVASIAMVAAFAAVTAQAQVAAVDRGQQVQRVFEGLDKNGDGQLDASEAQGLPSLSAAFVRLAADGSLSTEEFASWYRKYDLGPADE